MVYAPCKGGQRVREQGAARSISSLLARCRSAPGVEGHRAAASAQAASYGLPSHWRGLTAKLTANRANSCRSLATSADECELSTCIDGWQRTAMDGRGRVRSSPVAPGRSLHGPDGVARLPPSRRSSAARPRFVIGGSSPQRDARPLPFGLAHTRRMSAAITSSRAQDAAARRPARRLAHCPHAPGAAGAG
jgi:hypothetical protein